MTAMFCSSFRENGFDDVEFDLGNVSQFLRARPTGPPARSADGTPAWSQAFRLGFDRRERDSARHHQQDQQQPKLVGKRA
jgi:hypothetical protein